MEDRLAALKKKQQAQQPHPAWRAKIVATTSAAWGIATLSGLMFVNSQFKALEAQIPVAQPSVSTVTLPGGAPATLAPVTTAKGQVVALPGTVAPTTGQNRTVGGTVAPGTTGTVAPRTTTPVYSATPGKRPPTTQPATTGGQVTTVPKVPSQPPATQAPPQATQPQATQPPTTQAPVTTSPPPATTTCTSKAHAAGKC